MKIIALDIDDCIFPSNGTYFGRVDDNHIILEANLKRIKMMIEKYGMLVYITSSWHSILRLEDNNIFYTRQTDWEDDKPYYQEEKTAFDLLKKYLDGYVIGLSKGDRYADVNRLLDEGCIVVTLDDMDFSMINHKNHLWLELKGFIDNSKTWQAHNFLKEK